jgi:hypothetical protein
MKARALRSPRSTKADRRVEVNDITTRALETGAVMGADCQDGIVAREGIAGEMSTTSIEVCDLRHPPTLRILTGQAVRSQETVILDCRFQRVCLVSEKREIG